MEHANRLLKLQTEEGESLLQRVFLDLSGRLSDKDADAAASAEAHYLSHN